jgi:hypothetical protein
MKQSIALPLRPVRSHGMNKFFWNSCPFKCVHPWDEGVATMFQKEWGMFHSRVIRVIDRQLTYWHNNIPFVIRRSYKGPYVVLNNEINPFGLPTGPGMVRRRDAWLNAVRSQPVLKRLGGNPHIPISNDLLWVAVLAN